LSEQLGKQREEIQFETKFFPGARQTKTGDKEGEKSLGVPADGCNTQSDTTTIFVLVGCEVMR